MRGSHSGCRCASRNGEHDAHRDTMTMMREGDAEPREIGDGTRLVRPLLLTIPEAARVLAIGRSSVYELIDSRAIGVVRIGRSVRIPVAELELFVDRRSSA